MKLNLAKGSKSVQLVGRFVNEVTMLLTLNASFHTFSRVDS